MYDTTETLIPSNPSFERELKLTEDDTTSSSSYTYHVRSNDETSRISYRSIEMKEDRYGVIQVVGRVEHHQPITTLLRRIVFRGL